MVAGALSPGLGLLLAVVSLALLTLGLSSSSTGPWGFGGLVTPCPALPRLAGPADAGEDVAFRRILLLGCRGGVRVSARLILQI